MAYSIPVSIVHGQRQPKSASCYVCSGLLCDPRPEYLRTCNSSVSPDTVRCFFVAWENDHIYRGCYEVAGLHVEHCNRHRLTLCQVCRGQACNSAPIFQEELFSCYTCSRGNCDYKNVVQKLHYRTCPRFFTGHAPRCYMFCYYWRMQYVFGCTSDMQLYERRACADDTLYTVCRFCDVPNCNKQYFFRLPRVPNYRLMCEWAEGAYNCDIIRTFNPFVTCFYYEKDNYFYGGCLNGEQYDSAMKLVQDESLPLCSDTQICNVMDNFSKSRLSKMLIELRIC